MNRAVFLALVPLLLSQCGGQHDDARLEWCGARNPDGQCSFHCIGLEFTMQEGPRSTAILLEPGATADDVAKALRTLADSLAN